MERPIEEPLAKISEADSKSYQVVEVESSPEKVKMDWCLHRFRRGGPGYCVLNVVR